jgi:hypothetical protein
MIHTFFLWLVIFIIGFLIGDRLKTKGRPLWMTNDQLDKPAIIILHDDLADDHEFIAALYSLARQHFEENKAA